MLYLIYHISLSYLGGMYDVESNIYLYKKEMERMVQRLTI
ncbi:hypothetical protein L1F34_000887 [Mammaliicoccus lentus]